MARSDALVHFLHHRELIMRRLAILVPTYNEEALLTRFVDSLEPVPDVETTIVVINAGKPLSEGLAKRVLEVAVPDHFFWTACMQVGFEKVAEDGKFDFAMMGNADTVLVPGSVAELIKFIDAHPNTVACCPAYLKLGEEEPHLHYSDQNDWGFLLYGKMSQRWNTLSEAPKEPFKTDVIGGQGVLFDAKICAKYRLDPDNFPQAAGDHDFWYQLRKGEKIQLWVVPTAGTINLRQMGVQPGRKKGFFRRIWQRMTSDKTGDSARLMWRLRRKHLSLPVAVPSFVISFLIRYTLGLPKMLKRL
jgi:hypothetical protein